MRTFVISGQEWPFSLIHFCFLNINQALGKFIKKRKWAVEER